MPSPTSDIYVRMYCVSGRVMTELPVGLFVITDPVYSRQPAVYRTETKRWKLPGTMVVSTSLFIEGTY